MRAETNAPPDGTRGAVGSQTSMGTDSIEYSRIELPISNRRWLIPLIYSFAIAYATPGLPRVRAVRTWARSVKDTLQ